MKNLLEFLLIHLVEHPEDVMVEEKPTEHGVIYILHANQSDLGRVIGKKGSIIQAIRTIARVRAAQEGVRATIVLADQDNPETPTAADSDQPQS